MPGVMLLLVGIPMRERGRKLEEKERDVELGCRTNETHLNPTGTFGTRMPFRVVPIWAKTGHLSGIECQLPCQERT